MELLLDGWGVSPPGVLRGGGLSVRDLKATAATLHVDLTTATLLIEVSAQAGLLAEGADSDGDLRWLPTDAFDIWTTRPSASRARRRAPSSGGRSGRSSGRSGCWSPWS